jgi:alpha-amylase
MKVFLDIVVNHTADVISFKQGTAYVPLGKAPYRTRTGRPFDPWDYTSGTAFPRLLPNRSFAKTPVIDPALATAKGPALLNEAIRYHNRGNIDWGSCVGRCEMDGDFAGLDDLMTEDWAVVKALADAYGSWITKYGVDGFRIDTAKHVDPYFFGRWLPLISATADAASKPGFTSFGEAWLVDTAALSELMLARGLPSVLDFPFQDMAKKYVTGQATGGSLAALFADDDYYTSSSTNAYGLTTFLGNHDMGRIGFFLTTETQATGQALLERDLLAHDLLYLTRGVPVVYYGDEVGRTCSPPRCRTGGWRSGSAASPSAREHRSRRPRRSRSASPNWPGCGPRIPPSPRAPRSPGTGRTPSSPRPGSTQRRGPSTSSRSTTATRP